MGKLIYVDRLKKDILALHDCYNGFSDTYDKACIIDVIDEQPIIEERKSAYLIDPNPYGKCSNCGQLIDIRDDYNYCPNCGADMRKEGMGE